jgi:hypothetical protein
MMVVIWSLDAYRQIFRFTVITREDVQVLPSDLEIPLAIERYDKLMLE